VCVFVCLCVCVCLPHRLEFLGDAVLDFTIMRHIYFFLLGNSDMPDTEKPTPAILSRLRMNLTSNELFARITIENGFHTYLDHMSQPLFNRIHDYATSLDSQLVKAPKVLGDLFESLAGAVFVDSGGDLERTWRIFGPFLSPYLSTALQGQRKPDSILFDRLPK